MNGGYDDGYAACECFWGHDASSLVRELETHVQSFDGLRVFDAGCGEGKNAAYVAARGAEATGVDISELAITNFRKGVPPIPHCSLFVGDIRELLLPIAEFDIVIAYGLLHCLRDRTEIDEVVTKLQKATATNGWNVVCAFNDRFQELSAHPGFTPKLLPHADYLAMYSGWELIHASDSDLTETHPHNGIVHTHSMTRILARKVTQ